MTFNKTYLLVQNCLELPLRKVEAYNGSGWSLMCLVARINAKTDRINASRPAMTANKYAQRKLQSPRL